MTSIDKITSINQNINSELDMSLRKEFRILFWTNYYGTDEWSESNLTKRNCRFDNCILTEERKQLSASDAVLFHWRDINIYDWPLEHTPAQKWVLFNIESPENTYNRHRNSKQQIRPFLNQIDWTLTYRMDSDIYAPYGSVTKCQSNRQLNEDYFEGKTKGIAWVVSNCRTKSAREVYVKELQKHIEVDVYGGCGPFKCRHNCFPEIHKTYKFYLSFENSLCKDYVTEKLFRTLEYDIIPIVYGSADYKQILPNNSYINAMDFGSAKELSDYLKLVANDRQLYNSYMKWKVNYCAKHYHFVFLCDLCERLNQNPNQIQTNRKDIIEWWFDEANCRKGHVQLSIANGTLFIYSNYSVIQLILIGFSLYFF